MTRVLLYEFGQMHGIRMKWSLFRVKLLVELSTSALTLYFEFFVFSCKKINENAGFRSCLYLYNLSIEVFVW